MAPVEEIERLAVSISSHIAPSGGYSVRSLFQAVGDRRINVLTVFYLTLSPEPDRDEITDLGSGFGVASVWCSLSDAHQLLHDVEAAKAFRIGSTEIVFASEVTSPSLWHPSDFVRRRNGLWFYGMEMPATIWFYGIGRSMGVDKEVLRTHGFDTVNDLVWSLLLDVKGSRLQNSQQHTNTGVLVVIPHHVWIEAVQVDDNKCRVILGSDVTIPAWHGFRIRYKARSHSGLQTDGRFVAVGNDGMTEIPSPLPDVSSMTITLELVTQPGGVPLAIDEMDGEKERSRTNSRVLAHEFVDSESKTLEDRLLNPGNKDADFEWAVAVLLHLVGLGVEWWGCKSIKKGRGRDQDIDIIAFDDESKRVFAVECTTAQGDVDRKSRTLAARAVSLQDALIDGKKWEVFPVLCTPLTKKQLAATGLGEHQGGNTRILNRDDLEEMLRKVKAGVPKNQIVGLYLAYYYQI